MTNLSYLNSVLTMAIILNQLAQWNCKWYSFLAALMRMKEIDYLPIVEDLKKSDNLLTNQKAANWFVDKWHIKWISIIDHYQIKIMLHKKIPVVAGLANTTWNNSPPFIVSFGKDKWSHSICITGFNEWLYETQNSWWEKWWNKWFCYLKEEDVKKLIAPCRLII